MRTVWRPPPWFAAPAPRIRFLHELKAVGATTHPATKQYPGGFHIHLTLHADGLPARQVCIQFSQHSPDTPRVSVDGPTRSPHRYSDGTLCMWYPDDPRHTRWVPGDGAADLVTRIAVHLIKEAWWRRTAEWIGPEVTHGDPDPLNDPRQQIETD